MSITAGKLRHRIVIQQLAEGENDMGDIVQTWTDFAAVWASIEPLSGREYFSAQQVTSETTGRIRMRYRAGVLATMRVLFGGQTYRILSVINPEERNIELELMTKVWE